MADTTRLPWPVPAGLTPRQITAGLHAEIAAMSPGHAALAATFEAISSLPPAWDPAEEAAAARTAWLERAGQYAVLRSGLTQEAAARQFGICSRTARNYEVALRTGGTP